MMIIICILLILSGLFYYNLIKHITASSKELHSLQHQLQSHKKQYNTLLQNSADLKRSIKHQQQEYELQLHQNKLLKQTYDDLKKNYESGYLNFVQNLDTAYSKKEQEFQENCQEIKKSINTLQSELTATMEAKRKEEQLQNNINFYKLQLSNQQKADIQLLQQWKKQLSEPSIVSKIIWSTYVIKPTGELCNRLTNGKTICGIYKITSIISNKVYIGQSVNVSERIKQHIKCGLGIDASSTNKLYNLMQEQGVSNFTFEILQECNRNKLNQRERFWIETYQSKKFGLNVQGGNK